ncbi:MAG TPA: PEP-CTERM sorting domain-containing protein [Duganella sp.]|uniref:PEP-CTERM sorting domain-containing protein n=1 Tax=Duganella sp. TaxID=1904440 RepID=UPI002ED3C619
MKLLRAFISSAAIFASVHAHAAQYTYIVKGHQGLEGASPISTELLSLYPEGTTFNGTFTLDDSVPPERYPEVRQYRTGFSGAINAGGNEIRFADSLVYTDQRANGPSWLTMLGGNAWNTGGTISESQSISGLQLDGLQISLGFDPSLQLSNDAPLSTWMAAANPPYGSLYLNYVDANGQSFGGWWQITEMTQMSPVPEPESVVMLTMGIAVLLAAASRRRRQNEMNTARPQALL